MLPNKKKVRSNNIQLNILVDYMAAHKNFANGEFTGPLGNQNMNRQWDELKNILSQHGPDKSVEQWKHSWRDLKKRSREEGARVRQARQQTGNTSFFPSISENTSKVLNIIGKECAFGIGDPGETGIGSFIMPPHLNATSAGTTVSDVSCTSIPLMPITSTVTEMEIFEGTVCAEVSQPPQQVQSHHLSSLATSLPVPTPTKSLPVPNPTKSLPVPNPNTSLPVPNPNTSLPVSTPTPQQRRTGFSARANEFLAAEQETNKILKDILNAIQEGNLQKRMKHRQMLRQARTRRF